jgi:hypothetical protein
MSSDADRCTPPEAVNTIKLEGAISIDFIQVSY